MFPTALDRRSVVRSLLGLSGMRLVLGRPARAWAQTCSPTKRDIEGPFYTRGAPHRTALAGTDEPGDRIVLRGRVLGPDCQTPLRAALLDVWQADANGEYHYEKDNFRLRGQILTDATGAFEFASVVPGRYKLGGSYRPAHIHFTVSHPGHEPLTTQLYFKGDPYLAPKDACGNGCGSDDADRIVDLKKLTTGRGFGADFRIVLAGRKA
jgi:protocatechuate 3,4-dioxygenase beta subunit